MSRTSNNKNLGSFAAIFVAIFTLLWSVFKTITNIKSRNKELQKVSELTRKGLKEGLTEDLIIQLFCADAEKRLGRALTDSEKAKINDLVIKEKEKITKNVHEN